MADIERFDPRESGLIRNWVGRFIDDPRFLFPERAFGADFRKAGSPAFDVYETDRDVVVKAELPGFKPGDLDITVYADRATITGNVSEESEEKGANYLRRERRSGSFERTIALPSEVKAEGAKASFEHGVLQVRIPKTDDVKKRGRKVEIGPNDIRH